MSAWAIIINDALPTQTFPNPCGVSKSWVSVPELDLKDFRLDTYIVPELVMALP
jgi:hypothetical protein